MLELNPCFNVYRVTDECPYLWNVIGDPYHALPPGYNQTWFQQASVKSALHVPASKNWRLCASSPVFINDTDHSPPPATNGGPLASVVEKTNNVIVGHGLLDMVLIANGTLLALQNMTWHGKQGFSTAPNKNFFVPKHNDPSIWSQAGHGIKGQFVTERGLTFVTIEGAGHEVPMYQPSAAYRHLEKLLGRISSLDFKGPFSTG